MGAKAQPLGADGDADGQRRRQEGNSFASAAKGPRGLKRKPAAAASKTTIDPPSVTADDLANSTRKKVCTKYYNKQRKAMLRAGSTDAEALEEAKVMWKKVGDMWNKLAKAAK